MQQDSIIAKLDTVHNLGDAIYRFVLDGATTSDIKELGYEYSGLVFIIASILCGFLIIVLDILIVKARIRDKGSLFGFGYPNFSNAILVVLTWSLGSGLVSLIGSAINVLQDTLQSSIVASLSWIYIVSELIDNYKSKNDVNQKSE